MSKDKKVNEVITTREVLKTNDYTKFKIMDGNRSVDERHVKQLQKLMLANGNLTYEFPIIVGKDGYIIDGQHRFRALEGLGWEVGYIVEDAATIETVRAINQGNRNWSWRDIAYSYSDLGDENYTWFLRFVDQYGLKLSTAALILGGTAKKARETVTQSFRAGKLEISVPDRAKAHTLATQVTEVIRLVQVDNRDIASALVTVMQSPAYDHERMMDKLRSYGERLPARATIRDYETQLEAMFNFGYPEANKVRLF